MSYTDQALRRTDIGGGSFPSIALLAICWPTSKRFVVLNSESLTCVLASKAVLQGGEYADDAGTCPR